MTCLLSPTPRRDRFPTRVESAPRVGGSHLDKDHGILRYVEVGEVRRVDDAVTGFDRNKPGRPCVIVRVETPPRAGAWVLPGSTRGSTGTRVPRNTLPGLDKDGRFQFLPRWVSERDLADCPTLGVLPEPYRTAVLESANMVVIDLGDEL